MDVLEEVLLRLSEEDVKSIKVTSQNFRDSIKKIESDEEYWRKKLSNYLTPIEISQRVDRNWRKTYKNVLENKKDFFWMVKFNYLEIVEGLIKTGTDPSKEDNYAIRVACARGLSKMVELLLKDSRVNPAAHGNYSIRMASEFGFVDTVKILLNDPRVDPSDFNNYAIIWASDNGNFEIVKLLLENPSQSVDPGVDNNLPIRNAAEKGHYKVVKLLLEDPRVNPADEDNYAVNMALLNGHYEIVKLLLKDSRVKNAVNFDFLWKI